jgi:hypothetical protein
MPFTSLREYGCDLCYWNSISLWLSACKNWHYICHDIYWHITSFTQQFWQRRKVWLPWTFTTVWAALQVARFGNSGGMSFNLSNTIFMMQNFYFSTIIHFSTISTFNYSESHVYALYYHTIFMSHVITGSRIYYTNSATIYQKKFSLILYCHTHCISWIPA